MSQITSIESFKFKLEGFGTPIFEVYYQKYFVFYSTCKYIYGIGIEHNKEITIEALEMFKSKLNELILAKPSLLPSGTLRKNKYLNNTEFVIA